MSVPAKSLKARTEAFGYELTCKLLLCRKNTKGQTFDRVESGSYLPRILICYVNHDLFRKYISILIYYTNIIQLNVQEHKQTIIIISIEQFACLYSSPSANQFVL